MDTVIDPISDPEIKVAPGSRTWVTQIDLWKKHITGGYNRASCFNDRTFKRIGNGHPCERPLARERRFTIVVAAIERQVAAAVGEIMAISHIDVEDIRIASFRNIGARIDAETVEIVSSNKVYNPGESIRTIDCRRPARDYLDTLDERFGQVIDINRATDS